MDDAIYRQTYDAIVGGHLAPDTKLAEESLCDVFNVSRTVVRKALARLAHEGLLTIERNRGARVASPTADEARSVFEARRLVEVAAMPVICERMSEAALRDLRRLIADEEEAERAGGRRQLVRLSGEFHLRLLAVTGNEPLIEFLRQLVARSSLVVAVHGFAAEGRTSCRGHAPLLELLSASDAAGASAWMDSHLRDIEGALDFSSTEAAPDLHRVFASLEAERDSGMLTRKSEAAVY